MIEQHLLRILSHLDKNPLSPYFGCFDRNFWHYKMASDFPSAIYQMGTFCLTLAYTQQGLAPDFYQNDRIWEWVQASIRFWASLQKKDGSFNEWYPNEHCHVGTAFSTWGITESLLRLDADQRQELVMPLTAVFRKIGDFLEAHIDTIVLNHTAGAIAALYNLYLLTDDVRYVNILAKNKQVFFDHQDEEGWFPEYGEPDMGYLSVSIFFLAQYWQRSRDADMFESLRKAVDFLQYFVHPDGTIGGEYASRNTKYLFRYGLYLLASELPVAAKILQETDYAKLVNVHSADDRYFIFFFLPDFLLMHNKTCPEYTGRPEKDECSKHFANCGLFVHTTPKYQLIMNLKKGGAFKLFDRSKHTLRYSGLGYMYRLNANVVAATSGFGGGTFMIEAQKEQMLLSGEAPFVKSELHNPLENLFVFFRVFNLFFERFTWIHRIFDRYLKLKKVKSSRLARGSLKRQLVLTDTTVEIHDEFQRLDHISEMYELANLSFRFVPSSKYSCCDEMCQPVCQKHEWETKEQPAPFIRKFEF